jgi:hypothetical protein
MSRRLFGWECWYSGRRASPHRIHSLEPELQLHGGEDYLPLSTAGEHCWTEFHSNEKHHYCEYDQRKQPDHPHGQKTSHRQLPKATISRVHAALGGMAAERAPD